MKINFLVNTFDFNSFEKKIKQKPVIFLSGFELTNG